MSGLLVALMMTLAQADGGVPLTTGLNPADTVYASCPDAPPTEQVTESTILLEHAGWLLLHPDRAGRVACLLEACDADRRFARATLEGPKPPAWWGLMMGMLSLGIALGTGLGWLTK